MSQTTQNYRQTAYSMVDYCLNQHPDLQDAYITNYRRNIGNQVAAFHKNTVAHGPFAGLQLDDEASWSSNDRGSMILGIYEQEVLEALESAQDSGRAFIDLGAADGYYGIGVLVNNMFAKSYCYELTERGQQVIQQNAQLNNVVDRVIIRGKADKTFYQDIPEEDRANSVVLVDVEGAEFDLFDSETFAAFGASTILVELHEFILEEGDAKLARFKNDASATHTITELTMGARDLSKFHELTMLSDNDRWLLCSEGRPRRMIWLRLDPINKS